LKCLTPKELLKVMEVSHGWKKKIEGFKSIYNSALDGVTLCM
jgi:hypothetical protein